MNQVSNALGIINPIEKIIEKTRQLSNAYVLIDGAQSTLTFQNRCSENGLRLFCILRPQDVRANNRNPL